jgi:peptidoglycan-associated lipoprotein
MMKKAALLLLIGTTFLTAGCATQRDRLPPDPQGTNGGRGGMASRPEPGSHADFVASVASDRIFFDTDRFNVDGEDARILQSQAQWLAHYTNTRVVIEGHCDERGTRDYNLALGERRANAAKNYLASLGINPARISTVSYGKERPEAMGSDEGSWARNRRAVSVTIR